MNKKRFVSLFLVFMMVLSLFPTAAFAATVGVDHGASVSAEFEENLQTGTGDQTAVLNVGSETGAVSFMGRVDFGDLADYVTADDVTIDRASSSFTNDYSGSVNWNPEDCKFVGHRSGGDVTGNFVVFNIPLDMNSVPAGYYDVTVYVTEMIANDNTYYVADTEVPVPATLTVLDEHGNLPGATEETSYIGDITVQGGVEATVTVDGSAVTAGNEDNATSIEVGKVVTIKVTPTNGNELSDVTVTVTSGENTPVSVTGTGTDTLTFEMPSDVVSIDITAPEGGEEKPDLYPVIVEDTEYGDVTADKTEAAEGETVTITVTPEEGYEPSISITGPEGPISFERVPGTDDKFEFKMPAGEVTVDVTFEVPSEDGYDINYTPSEGGKVEFSQTENIPAGEDVTVTVTPDEGKKVDDIIITGPNGQILPTENDDGTLTFPMPEGDVTVSVTFEDDDGEEILYTIESVIDTDTGTGLGKIAFNPVDVTTTGVPAGTEVLVGVQPENGSELKSISAIVVSGDSQGDLALRDNNNGTYTLVMPEGNVQVTAVFDVIEFVDPNNSYDLTLTVTDGEAAHGTASLNNVTTAEAGSTVNVYVRPNTGYTVQVEVAHAGTDVIEVTNAGTSDVPGQLGAIIYQFIMPSSDADITVTFVEESGGSDVTPGGDGGAGQMTIVGTVTNQNGQPLEGATVVVAPVAGQGSQQDSETVKTDENGQFKVPAVNSQLNYTINASYDTGVLHGKYVGVGNGGQVCTSRQGNISAAGEEYKDEAVTSTQNLTITVYYDWDITNDGLDNNGAAGDPAVDDKGIERIFAGADGELLTSDDYYFHVVPTPNGGTKVQVVAGNTGDLNMVWYDDLTNPENSRHPHYNWVVSKDGDPVPVYVHDDSKAGHNVSGACDDFYLFDVDYNPDTADVEVFIDGDAIPATSDDYYIHDVNGDGSPETVHAGADGYIGTEDDWYEWDVDGDGEPEHVFAGDDCIAGTEDDWYMGDADGHGGDDDVIYIGEDRIPGTDDDYYLRDVDSDGEDEKIYAGEDGKFNTGDDFYQTNIPADDEDGTIVNVYPGETGDENDPFEFGRPNDHYDWTVGGKPVIVYVGEDTQAGTDDDWYEFQVPTPGQEVDEDGNPVNDPVDMTEVIVNVGPDGIPGTVDDTYDLDADMDGEDELIHVGPDGIPGTSDDYYDEDKNGDGNPERVYAGDDGIFGTPDDYYEAIVNTPDGTQEKVPVYAGEDGVHSPVDDPDNDDWYPWDTTDDDVVDPDIYDGDDTHDKVFIDGDSFAGTDDDYYFEDVDGDGEDEKVWVGGDTIPGTEDDYYKEDVNGDGKEEDITAGEDSEFGTDDDYYPTDDIDGDGEPEKVFPGEDGELGTPDDWYEADVDKDGEDEIVYVGDDKIPGTDDDWYYAKITFNATPGTVNGASTWSALTSELTSLPTASRSGSYRFVGWSLSANSSSVLTLDQVKALKTDTVLYAYYRYTGSTGGGGGGGGGGGSSSYTVRFDSNGGSSVSSQRVSRGDTVDEPRDPTREGYEFTGWYTNSSCTRLYDFDDRVYNSFTLYAGWEKSEDVIPGGGNPVHDAVSDILQLYPHISYISGYGNGKVGPNDNMTRAQAAQVFYRLLNAETRNQYYSTSNRFTDCDPNAWYNEAVSTLSNLGIIAGYGNGKFGPNDTITRAQFATICARIGRLTPSYESSFTDVSTSHWAYRYIIAAADNNWVAGYGDGRFGPDDTITRAQVVTILNRVLEREPLADSTFEGFDYNDWTDNNPDAWYYHDMIEAGTGHTCEDDANGVERWTGVLD